MALDQLVEREFSRIGRAGDTAGIKPASTRALGDETAGYAGEMLINDPSSPIDALVVGLVFVRDGEFVHFGIGGALAGDPLVDVLGVLEETVGRSSGPSATPVGDAGLWTGGLWEMLPTIANLAEGFVFADEKVPEPFDPLPGQAE